MEKEKGMEELRERTTIENEKKKKKKKKKKKRAAAQVQEESMEKKESPDVDSSPNVAEEEEEEEKRRKNKNKKDLKRKIEDGDGLEPLLVEEKRPKLEEASGQASTSLPENTKTKKKKEKKNKKNSARKSQETTSLVEQGSNKDPEAATTTTARSHVEQQNGEELGDGQEEEGTEEDHGKDKGNLKSTRENASKKQKKKVTIQVPEEEEEEVQEDSQHDVVVAMKEEDEPEEEDMASDMASDVASDAKFSTWKTQHLRPNLVHGKFTKKEDEELKKAIFDYIKGQGLDEKQGLAKVLNSQSHKDCRGCWRQVSKSLPHRSFRALYARAHRLLMPGTFLGKWNEEEVGALMKFHKQHGNNWRKIAQKVGRYAYACKDKWRETKLKRAKGKWTLEELEKLRMLVHTSLRVNAQLKKEPSDSTTVDRRHFRDNINWQFISDQMESRPHHTCLNTWYNKLASSMVSTGDWANTDDSLLLQRIMEDCPVAEEWVEWDSLLEHRSGEVCHKRWQEMARTLGEPLSFIDQLEVLIKIFAPELLEDKPNEADKKFKEDYDAFTSRQVSNNNA